MNGHLVSEDQGTDLNKHAIKIISPFSIVFGLVLEHAQPFRSPSLRCWFLRASECKASG